MSGIELSVLQAPGVALDSADDAGQELRTMLRDSARDFATSKLPRTRLRVLRDDPVQSLAQWPAVVELGWTGLMVASELEGSGLGLQEMALVLEELGRVAAPEPLTACAVLATKAISLSDRPALRASLLQGIVNGSLVPAVAWQESSRLAPVEVCATRAQREGQQWRLQGAKLFVRPGVHWDGAVVSANTDAGVALFWVPRASQGLSMQVRSLTDGSPSADLRLDGVYVADENLLASPATATVALSHALDVARIAVSAELLGVIRGALELSIEHLRTREQFGAALGTFQALRHRVVELYLQQELVAASLEDACRQCDAGLNGEALARTAARVKARASSAALLVTKSAVQFHGAMGYTDECDAGLYLKRALALSAWLGNAPELLAQAATLPAVALEERGMP